MRSLRNAQNNNIKNAYFHRADAGEFVVDLIMKNEEVDVIIMNPTRLGSDEIFLSSMCRLNSDKIIYIATQKP